METLRIEDIDGDDPLFIETHKADDEYDEPYVSISISTGTVYLQGEGISKLLGALHQVNFELGYLTLLQYHKEPPIPFDVIDQTARRGINLEDEL